MTTTTNNPLTPMLLFAATVLGVYAIAVGGAALVGGLLAGGLLVDLARSITQARLRTR